MIKKLAWDTFKNTGNINTFLELHEFENIEKSFDKHQRLNTNVTNTANPYLNDALNKNIENNSTNKHL